MVCVCVCVCVRVQGVVLVVCACVRVCVCACVMWCVHRKLCVWCAVCVCVVCACVVCVSESLFFSVYVGTRTERLGLPLSLTHNCHRAIQKETEGPEHQAMKEVC